MHRHPDTITLGVVLYMIAMVILAVAMLGFFYGICNALYTPRPDDLANIPHVWLWLDPAYGM